MISKLNTQLTTAGASAGFTSTYMAYMDETNFLTRSATYPVLVCIPPNDKLTTDSIITGYTTEVTLYAIGATTYGRDDLNLSTRATNWKSLKDKLSKTLSYLHENSANFTLVDRNNINIEYLDLGKVIDNCLTVRATFQVKVNC